MSKVAEGTLAFPPEVWANMSRQDRRTHIHHARATRNLQRLDATPPAPATAVAPAANFVTTNAAPIESPNPFSLSATLNLYPDLRDAYVPDWDLDDGQLAFESITNGPAIIKKIATAAFDPSDINA